MSQATSLPDVPIVDGYAPQQASAGQPSPPPQQGKPHFRITGLQVPSSVAPGAAVEADITIVNDGQAQGAVEARILDAQGNIVASQQATLQPNQSATLKLRFTAPSSPGTYSYKAEAYNTVTKTVDDSRTFSITVQSQGSGGGGQPQPQPQPQPQTQAQPKPSSWILALGIVALIGIAALAFAGRESTGGQQAQA